MSNNFKNAYTNNPNYSPINEFWGRNILHKIEAEKHAKKETIHHLNGGITEEMDGKELVTAGPPEWIAEYIRQGISVQKDLRKKEAELQELIAKWYNNRWGLDINGSSEVVTTIGGAFGVDAAARIIAGPGDEVLIMDPDYVTYMPQVASTGATIVSVPLKEEKGEWHFEPEELERSKSKMQASSNEQC